MSFTLGYIMGNLAHRIWTLIKDAASSFSNDYAPSMGAALAYYTMFSIAPLLFLVIMLAGLVFGEEAARGEIFSQLQGLMGEQGAAAIQAMVQSVKEPATGAIGPSDILGNTPVLELTLPTGVGLDTSQAMSAFSANETKPTVAVSPTNARKIRWNSSDPRPRIRDS